MSGCPVCTHLRVRLGSIAPQSSQKSSPLSRRYLYIRGSLNLRSIPSFSSLTFILPPVTTVNVTLAIRTMIRSRTMRIRTMPMVVPRLIRVTRCVINRLRSSYISAKSNCHETIPDAILRSPLRTDRVVRFCWGRVCCKECRSNQSH